MNQHAPGHDWLSIVRKNGTAEFGINDVDSEVARRAVSEAVKDLNGVRDVQFVGGGAIVTYNPLGISKEEICTAIRRSGYRATEIGSRT